MGGFHRIKDTISNDIRIHWGVSCFLCWWLYQFFHLIFTLISILFGEFTTERCIREPEWLGVGVNWKSGGARQCREGEGRSEGDFFWFSFSKPVSPAMFSTFFSSTLSSSFRSLNMLVYHSEQEYNKASWRYHIKDGCLGFSLPFSFYTFFIMPFPIFLLSPLPTFNSHYCAFTFNLRVYTLNSIQAN